MKIETKGGFMFDTLRQNLEIETYIRRFCAESKTSNEIQTSLLFMISQQAEAFRLALKEKVGNVAIFRQHTHEILPNGGHGGLESFPNGIVEVQSALGEKNVSQSNIPDSIIFTGFDYQGKPVYGIDSIGISVIPEALDEIAKIHNLRADYVDFMLDYMAKFPALAPILSQLVLVSDTTLDNNVLSQRNPGDNLIEEGRLDSTKHRILSTIETVDEAAIVGFLPEIIASRPGKNSKPGDNSFNCHAYYRHVKNPK